MGVINAQLKSSARWCQYGMAPNEATYGAHCARTTLFAGQTRGNIVAARPMRLSYAFRAAMMAKSQ